MRRKEGLHSTHLTREERGRILTEIEKGASQTAIAKCLEKDNSTIGKEIKKRRILKYKSSLLKECSNYKKCRFGRKCTEDCPDFQQFKCRRRDHSPGACNGCSKYSYCRFDKYYYDPDFADREYRKTLVESRVGVNLTDDELKNIADIAGPLLKQGQSPYVIISNHPELGICERTFYNYLESGLFKEYNHITSYDLRRQPFRKVPKYKKGKLKKRENRKLFIGRTYDDYKDFIAQNSTTSVLQMDTVYNSEQTGPFIQTFKFLDTGLLFAVLQREKTAKVMADGVNYLENVLGTELFRKHAAILLTDRGSEFMNVSAMEYSIDGSKRTSVFYCDPMCAHQKGSLENNHELLRYICPKKTDLYNLGLTNQEKLNLVLSHINSMPVEKFAGKSPLEMTEFLYPDLYKKLVSFGIHKIERDQITLKPYILKD